MNVQSLLVWLCMQLSGAFPENKMIVTNVVVSHLFWCFCMFAKKILDLI